jgi:hypothetical protein
MLVDGDPDYFLNLLLSDLCFVNQGSLRLVCLRQSKPFGSQMYSEKTLIMKLVASIGTAIYKLPRMRSSLLAQLCAIQLPILITAELPFYNQKATLLPARIA